MLGNTMDFNQVGKIERGLGFFMRPVDPDPDFVQKLGVRLRNPKNITLEDGSRTKSAALLVLISGLVVGILSLFLLRRLR
jgi:hypothetical protein